MSTAPEAPAKTEAVAKQVVKPISKVAQERRASLAGKQDIGGAPVRLIVSTTRSPRVFPILSQISTFDQVITKKLPGLRERIKPADQDLYHMVTALEQKRDTF